MCIQCVISKSVEHLIDDLVDYMRDRYSKPRWILCPTLCSISY